MSELVVILKDGTKQRNVKGAVLADKANPPFTERRDGYRLRWWGVDHPASVKIRALVGKAEYTNGLCPFMAECYKTLGLVSQHCSWNLDNPRTWQFCGGYKRRKKGMG